MRLSQSDLQATHYSGDTIDHTTTIQSTTPYTSQNKFNNANHTHNNSVLDSEVIKFGAMASDWWDPYGSVGPLHTMNPLRINYIKSYILQYHPKKDDSIQRTAAQPLAGYTILDIGCGGGLLCESLARLGAIVHGIDATQQAIYAAQQHIALDSSIRENVTYQYITAEELVQQNKKYDVVCALEIVEHVNNQTEFVNTIKQLVDNNGALFMSTLNKTYISYLLAIVGAEYIARLVARGTHDWNQFISPAQLTQYITNDTRIQSHHNNNQQANDSNNAVPATSDNKFDIVDVSGMVYNPLTRNWWLMKNNLQCNYILYAKSNYNPSTNVQHDDSGQLVS